MLCHTVLQCAFRWSRYIVDRRSWVAYVRAQKQMLLGQTTLDAIIIVLSLIRHYELRSELHSSCDACHHIYILSFTLLFSFIYLYTSHFSLSCSIFIPSIWYHSIQDGSNYFLHLKESQKRILGRTQQSIFDSYILKKTKYRHHLHHLRENSRLSRCRMKWIERG